MMAVTLIPVLAFKEDVSSILPFLCFCCGILAGSQLYKVKSVPLYFCFAKRFFKKSYDC